MDGTVRFFNTPTGRAVLVGVGFIIWMAGMIFATGMLQVAMIALGLILIISAAGLGGPVRRDDEASYRGDQYQRDLLRDRYIQR